ncbi:SGNH/GDSL hydrolase family protein, partial [bacterium]|nr:SGNH/GDSL hydrolase family protein [bacterium]
MSDTAKKIVLLLVAVVGTLGVGEVVLRALDYGTLRPELNFGVNTRMSLDKGQFEPDPDLFWKMPPHPLDAGMRAVQPDRPLPPRMRTHRILVLGDSCSKISRQIPPYSVLLEDTLSAEGLSVEVWNASVPGYTSWQGRAWLDRQLLDLAPEVAVIYFGWNDHWRSTGVTDAAYAARQRGGALRLARLLQRPPAVSPLRVSADEYEANLTAMTAALAARGAAVVLVAAPSHLTAEARAVLVRTGYLNEDDDPVALHRDYLLRLKKVADATDAVMLNASALFAGLEAPDALILRDGIHLTDQGHQVLAAALAEV